MPMCKISLALMLPSFGLIRFDHWTKLAPYFIRIPKLRLTGRTVCVERKIQSFTPLNCQPQYWRIPWKIDRTGGVEVALRWATV